MSAFAGAALMVPFAPKSAKGAALHPKLSDPSLQPKFVNLAPNALDPGYKFTPGPGGEYTVGIGPMSQMTGLLNKGTPVPTPLWGYGQGGGYFWPGKTFEVASGPTNTVVNWLNELQGVTSHLVPVDTSIHWCFSLPGYDKYTIGADGVPIITHLHGGHSDFQYDGNPEFFYTPGGVISGPQWANVPGGFTSRFVYDNNVRAGNLWYHDHALGITRLNVYAGLAGLYFIRDSYDPGTLLPSGPNDLGLPKFPYELAYAIQDRMFQNGGQLFFPARPSDPFWDVYITGMGLKNGDVPKPSALAEFFGDHMLVNGMIWPKADVEPRHYRMRLLNGCDSRFLVLQFAVVQAGTTTLPTGYTPLPFYAIGSDQGLAASANPIDTLVFEPGSRYDIVFDFSQVPAGSRVILANIGGDAPYGGVIPGPGPYTDTDRVMAFDVTLPVSAVPDTFDPAVIDQYGGNSATTNRVRKLGLFEGTDEYGRIQPLLGPTEPATDYMGNPVNYLPADPNAPGQINGATAWHSPTTENPALGDTEEWWIYNTTPDAHPIHVHLVNFEVLGRRTATWDVIPIQVLQHNGALGTGSRITNIVEGPVVPLPTGHVENTPKDMVTAIPGQVTKIKATFDKPGRYVWHCHILSHEDHEMMRVLHVGAPAAMPQVAQNADVQELQALPDEFAMGKNYPNPFREATSIRYQLPADSRVSVEVYNVSGRKVKTLVAEVQKADRYVLEWNGLSDAGNPVSPGVYIYKMKAKAVANGKAFSAMEKMVKSW